MAKISPRLTVLLAAFLGAMLLVARIAVSAGGRSVSASRLEAELRTWDMRTPDSEITSFSGKLRQDPRHVDRVRQVAARGDPALRFALTSLMVGLVGHSADRVYLELADACDGSGSLRLVLSANFSAQVVGPHLLDVMRQAPDPSRKSARSNAAIALEWAWDNGDWPDGVPQLRSVYKEVTSSLTAGERLDYLSACLRSGSLAPDEILTEIAAVESGDATGDLSRRSRAEQLTELRERAAGR